MSLVRTVYRLVSIEDETDLDESPATEANLPPVGEHDAIAVPDLPDSVATDRDHGGDRGRGEIEGEGELADD